MTLILKLNFNEGVLILSDKQATSEEGSRRRTKKLFGINSNFCIGIATGNENLLGLIEKINPKIKDINKITKDLFNNLKKFYQENIRFYSPLTKKDNSYNYEIENFKKDMNNLQLLIVGIKAGEIKSKIINGINPGIEKELNGYIGHQIEFLDSFENIDTSSYDMDEVIKYGINLLGKASKIDISIGDPNEYGLDMIIFNRKEKGYRKVRIENISYLNEDLDLHFGYKWGKSNLKYKTAYEIIKPIKSKTFKNLKSNELSSILELIKKDSKNYHNSKNIEGYLQKCKLSSDDWLFILSNLAIDKDIFHWLDFICINLDKCSKNDSFINTLILIMNKLENDMARGSFIEAIINLSEKDITFSKKLLNELAKYNNNFYVRQYAGYVLGGIGKINFENTFNFIKEGWDKEEYLWKPIKLKALRIMFYKDKTLKEKEEIIKILDKVSVQSGFFELMWEALNINFEFMKFEPDLCYKNILKLIKVDDKTKDISIQVRNCILDLIRINGLEDPNKEFEIMKECSKEDSNKYILNNLILTLLEKYNKNPDEALKIILSFIQRGFYIDKIIDFDYVVNELIKKDRKRVISAFNKYLREEKRVMPLHILSLVVMNLKDENEDVKTLYRDICIKLKNILKDKENKFGVDENEK